MVTKRQLFNIDNAAHFDPGQDPRPEVSEEINGVTFSVRYNVANRKCYDSLPTPTACYKIDGKRVSRKVFYSHADRIAIGGNQPSAL